MIIALLREKPHSHLLLILIKSPEPDITYQENQ